MNTDDKLEKEHGNTEADQGERKWAHVGPEEDKVAPDQRLLDQVADLKAKMEAAEAQEQGKDADFHPNLTDQELAAMEAGGLVSIRPEILAFDPTLGEPMAGVIDAVRAAHEYAATLSDLAKDVERARQQLTDQGLEPRPGESTQEFLHRGLNTSGAGEIGQPAEELRAAKIATDIAAEQNLRIALEEDTQDFLGRVGPIPMTEGFAHGIPTEDRSEPTAPGVWARDLDGRDLAEVRLARTYARDFAHGTAGHHRLILIAQLADMLDQGDPIKPKPDPLTISRHVLDVQYHSQHEFDAQLTRRDCGPACIEMIGEHLRPDVDHSTDEIMVRITKGVDRSTYISELQKAALEMFQITLHRVENCSNDPVAGLDPGGQACHFTGALWILLHAHGSQLQGRPFSGGGRL